MFDELRTMLAAFVVTTGLALPASADIIVLISGKTMRGEVIAEDRNFITFRWGENNIWATTRVDRRDIETFLPEEGDQSDRGAEEGAPDDEGEGSAEREEAEEDAIARPPADTTRIAWLSLHGQVGGLIDNRIEGTFDAGLVQQCFEEAHRQGADVIVLDIHSPGGLVDEMEAICDTIIEWQDRLRIVAWPNEAYSAAAIITMCCPEILVRENSLIGAATIVQRQGNQTTALEAKMASPHYARQRQYMERSGHPYDVVAAMTIQETRLWWSPLHGFTTEQPAPAGDWTEVDNQQSILTLTATNAVDWGIAGARAASQREVLAQLAIPTPKTEILDLSDVITDYQRDLDRGISNIEEQFEIYIRGLASLNQSMIALLAAERRRNSEQVDSLRKDIVREIGRIRAAGRMIHRVDQRALQGRVNVPKEFLERISIDSELLSQVARFASDNDWTSAAQTLGEVLAAWRKLTGNQP